ncbi:MAG: hypothetical protein KDI56_14600 [Xanthomonadales bacterium]|nr:hypothetical protein [Xanthomonadales bacterium]
MLDPAAALALAEQVSETARTVGFETALIGATALAVHRYTRGTEDIDLAAHINPFVQLQALERALADQGLRTLLRLPDDDDPLGGVLVVWASGDDDGEPANVVEVVNFLNPGRTGRTPAAAAIARSEALPDTSLRCVGIADLVALKLYAGGLSDHADIVQLLARNPEADLAFIRETAEPFDRGGHLDLLLQQAEMTRSERL